MKKNYMLLLLSLSVTLGMAQVKNTQFTTKLTGKSDNKSIVQIDKKQLVKENSTKAVISVADVVPYSFASFQDAMKAQQAAAIETKMIVGYGRPDGTMYQGYTRDYRAYQNYLFLYSPAHVVTDYDPYSNRAGVNYSWYYNGGDSVAINDPVDADGILHFTPGITPSGYFNYMPRVKGVLADTTVSFVLGKGLTGGQYMYGGSVSRDSTDDGTVFHGTTEFPPLTVANMHENRPTGGNLYSGFTNVGGFSSTYSNDNGPCVGVMQVIPQQKSPFYVESMSILAFESGGAAVPSGGVLKLDLFYLTSEGGLGTQIASSTTSEFVKTYTDQGVFIFTFKEEEDGFIVDKPITIGTEAPVVVRITGFDATWNVTFLMGTNRTHGSSYTLHGPDLKVSTFGYSNAPTTPRADLYIQFNGMYNCLVPDSENPQLDFPLEGGWGISGYKPEDNTPYNDILIYSSYNMDADMTDVWIESAPDWITGYDVDTTYYADYNALMLFFQATPLPEGMTGRSGDIIVSSHGVSTTIRAIQGTQTSVDRVIKSDIQVVISQNNFNIKYPSDFNEVSVYTVSGQQVGHHELPVTGQATIPANLTKGIYLLKFSGTKTETIKIIK